MIKKTLYFGNPAYLRKKNNQLEIKTPKNNKKESKKDFSKITQVPIEDIGIIILDHGQITLSQGLLSALVENNTAVITCNNKHHPIGLFLNLDANQLQSEKFQDQIEASVPLKKQLWQQTISTKIKNQASLLKKREIPITNMMHWAKKVRSGDPDNYEGRAAAYYWKNLFPEILEFTRDRYGEAPNQLLNYGYAILRAVVARSLVASGLLPTLGIHHHNKYNAYCLADDIMEPYRPFVDEIVCTIVENGEDFYEMSKSIKEQLLEIPTVDIVIEEKRSPLMVGIQRTTSSLAKCYEGIQRKILYPEILL